MDFYCYDLDDPEEWLMFKERLKAMSIRDNNSTPASSLSSAPHPPWIELPPDVTENILHRLGPMEILESAQKVCTTWQCVCLQPSMWRVINMKKPDQIHFYLKQGNLCRRAVDRSQGELIHVSIQHFCTDELLQYVTDRARSLKYLRIVLCNFVSTSGLKASLKNFPLLEELHISFVPSISDLDIETIGVCCPMLKAFTFNHCGYRCPFLVRVGHALSIAKNMPNLRHLSLVGSSWLSNIGLEAILDGCPKLELLDLRKCIGVDLECDIGRRCLEQIKEVRRPFELAAEYELDYAIHKEEDDLYTHIYECNSW